MDEFIWFSTGNMDEFIWFLIGGIAGCFATLVLFIVFLNSILCNEDEHD